MQVEHTLPLGFQGNEAHLLAAEIQFALLIPFVFNWITELLHRVYYGPIRCLDCIIRTHHSQNRGFYKLRYHLKCTER